MSRRAKIVCTLGPATSSAEQITALVESGMDVARLNFSHGAHADHETAYRLVRQASDKTGRAVAVLADLQGPKIRLGRFADGPHLWATGSRVCITVEDVEGTADRVSTTYKDLANDVRVGDRLLVDDGKVALSVVAVEGPDVFCLVVEGGEVSNNKGLSLPGVAVSVPPLSQKDIEDLRFALHLSVDFIALSFVRSPADADLVRDIMRQEDVSVPIIAKLEKPEAVENLEAVVEAFDGLMVARGDLGVELALEEVPLVQKRAVQAARERNKPVIVATQMLESMIYT
jgi:pyruvate kinase